MSFHLPEPIVDSLLAKLGHDDDFRAAFQADARAALASLGFAPAADAGIREGIWVCLSVSELASKEAIRASHDALRRQLGAARASYNPIGLTVAVKHDRAAA
jgi:putative modified peptide